MIIIDITIKNRCPECRSKEFKHDQKQELVYCPQCGLVVKNQELPTLQDLEYIAEKTQQEIRKNKNKNQSVKNCQEMNNFNRKRETILNYTWKHKAEQTI